MIVGVLRRYFDGRELCIGGIRYMVIVRSDGGYIDLDIRVIEYDDYDTVKFMVYNHMNLFVGHTFSVYFIRYNIYTKFIGNYMIRINRFIYY